MTNKLGLGKVIFSIILIVLFYVMLTIYSDINKINKNFIQINITFLFPILFTYVLVMFVSSLRQKFLLNQMGFKITTKDSFFLSVAGLSMMITPVGSGQIIKTYYMKKKYGYPLNRTFPLLLAERFSDLIVVTSFVLISTLVFFSVISLIVLIISYTVLALFIVIVFNYKFFSLMKKLFIKIPFISQRIGDPDELICNIKKTFQTRIIVKSLIITTIGVTLESLVVYLGFKAFNVNLEYLETTQMFYTSIIGGALSLIPGGVGLTEGSFVNLLIHKNFSLDLATSLIIFIRMTTVWFATILGFLFSLVIMKKINTKSKVSDILDNPTTWEFGRIILDLIFGLYRNRFKKISKDWRIENNLSVIDIGCGIGQYSKITSGEYLGIDLNQKYIQYCNKKYSKTTNRSFRCADVTTLLDENVKFDIVLMVDFLHHIPDDLAKKILITASALAKKHVICFEPILEQSHPVGKWIINNDRGDHIRSLDDLHKLFANANCKIIESSELRLGPIRSRAILAAPIT